MGLVHDQRRPVRMRMETAPHPDLAVHRADLVPCGGLVVGLSAGVRLQQAGQCARSNPPPHRSRPVPGATGQLPLTGAQGASHRGQSGRDGFTASRRASNDSRPRRASRTLVSAVADAIRGAPSTRDISPNISPGPRAPVRGPARKHCARCGRVLQHDLDDTPSVPSWNRMSPADASRSSQEATVAHSVADSDPHRSERDRVSRVSRAATWTLRWRPS